MVPGTDSHTGAVDDGRDVMRMQAIDVERDDRTFARARSINLNPRQLGNCTMSIS